MILLIDNYDSFVHNLARYFVEMGCDVDVVRNDATTIENVRRRQPKAVVISPGPCTPDEAGISVQLVRELAASVPILGVCLGHQAIAAAFGGKVIRGAMPVHGRTSLIRHAGTPLFDGLTNPFRATRYHSLVVDQQTLPESLKVTATTFDGIPMAIEHRTFPTYGVQFHPESVLTDSGHRLLANFLKLAGVPVRETPTGDRVAAQPADGDAWSSVESEWQKGQDPAAGPLHW
ncbi:MAG: aminodeoxychorismate/anthranilate synthase component II [Planctomycetaceae bacterium]